MFLPLLLNQIGVSNMRFLRFCLPFIAVGLMSSCATLFNANDRHLSVTANVPGGNILYNGVSYGMTPGTVNVTGYKILAGPVVSVEKEGYQTQTKEVPTELQPWAIVSFLLGIVPGVVDLATGNAVRLATSEMHFELAPKNY